MRNNRKGFSLVELIVAIAIMAVMTMVLAPSLVGYVEKARAQKDDSAMHEVVNSVRLAIADQDIYDEVLCYSVIGNVSCYIDRDSETDDMDKIITKSGIEGFKTRYKYGDEYREKDEEWYYAAGNMRGITITFQPEYRDGDSFFVLSDAIVNKFIQTEDNMSEKLKASTNLVADNRDPDGVLGWDRDMDYTENGTVGTMTTGTNSALLYDNLERVHGTEIEIESQTYRNSEFTVFIHVGVLNSSDNEELDPTLVYGQWGGYNLFAID